MTSEEPPEEPHTRSEPALLSPASPKPIHFPAPTNIPVLTNMMDVDFNQTELHMSEPTMRNTEIRDGAWKEADIPVQDDTEAVSIVALNDEGDGAAGGQQAAKEEAIEDNTNASGEQPTVTTMPSTVDLAEHSGGAIPDTSTIALSEINNAALPISDDLNSLLNSLKAAPPTVNSTTPSTNLPLTSVPNVVPQTGTASAEQPTAGAPTPNDTTASLPNAEPSFTSGHANAPSTMSNTIENNATHDLLAELTASLSRGAATATTSFPNQSVRASTSPLASSREKKLAAGEKLTDDDIRWTADVQREYDDFIKAERQHVNDGRWDSFPVGSRLFIGNLSSDSVTKRDIFHVFHIYGKLAQISIKQAYGFVQFLVAPDAERAMAAEEGRDIRGKKIHIEVSHPQRSRNQQQSNRERRSRSPERRGTGRGDRYRGDDHRSGNRDRSPHNYRDRYDDRRRRSPSPDYRKSRYNRSPSPRSRRDELDLPMRAPDKIPDLQIILRDNLDPRFVNWIEDAFRAARLRTAVLAITARQNEQAIIQRQILEGVTAISVLDISSQTSQRIGVQIFDRSRGPHDIRFQEFSSLSPDQAAGLVLAALPRGQHQYNSMPGFPPGAPPPMPAPQYMHSLNPPLSNPPARYMPAPFPPAQAPPGMPASPGFQNFLDNMQQGHAQPLTPQSASSNGYPNFQQPPQQQGYPPRQQFPYGSQPMQPHGMIPTPSSIAQQSPYQMSPANSAPPSTNPQQPPNMQEILARLGNYNK
ncbi:hypothetical protein MRB53_038587 [Persea americana]|nr:hypothetical protein MRB53_038587 [Persea americana]